jgi:hypothetical protein
LTFSTVQAEPALAPTFLGSSAEPDIKPDFSLILNPRQLTRANANGRNASPDGYRIKLGEIE